MTKDKLIDLLVVRGVATREQLQSKYVHDLEQMLDDSNLAQIRAETQRRVATDPRVIAAEQQNRIVDENLAFIHIFRTPINGHGILVDIEANRNFLRSQVDEIRGDQLGPAWLKKVLAENPALANQLAWQSVDILNPVKRKQAAAAQDRADHEVFEETTKRSCLYAINEANWTVLHSVLGSGFSEYQIREAVTSGAVRVSPATQEELAAWAQEAAETRADFLINRASPSELREAARLEAEQRRVQFQQQEAERSLAEREKADKQFGYPPLPEFNLETSERIDAAYLHRLSNVDRDRFKMLLRKYGNFALTQRLRGA